MAVLGETLRRIGPRAVRASHRHVWVESVVVTAIIVVAAVLRFTSIGDKSFWADEAYSAFVASQPPEVIISLARRGDAHPPLYYLALSLWSQLFGADDIALRSLGAVASILTVGGTWWLGRRLGGPSVGAVAAFLTAVAPFQVLAAQEARMYPLLGLLLVLSWSALLVALDGRRWGWAGYVVATTLALYTNYFAVLVIIGQGIFVFATASRFRPSWLVSQLVIVMMYLPWLGTFFGTVFSGRGFPFLRLPVGIETLTALLGLLSFGGHGFGFQGWFGGHAASVPAQAAILAPFLGLATVSVASLWKHPRVLWVIAGYLIIPIAVAFIFSLRNNVIYPRYFSFLFPPFAMLLAFGIHSVAASVAPAFQKTTGALLGAILLLFSVPVLLDISTNPKYHVFNYKSAAAWLAAEAGPNDLVVVIPGFARFPLSRYFRGPQQITPMDPYELSDLGTGRARNDPAAEAYSRALFRSYTARHNVMWVVTDSGLPETALVRLGSLLHGIYDLRSVAGFNAIRIFKTVRHSMWERNRVGPHDCRPQCAGGPQVRSLNGPVAVWSLSSSSGQHRVERVGLDAESLCWDEAFTPVVAA